MKIHVESNRQPFASWPRRVTIRARIAAGLTTDDQTPEMRTEIAQGALLTKNMSEASAFAGLEQHNPELPHIIPRKKPLQLPEAVGT
ncbi:hypothetical protein [Agrobacterium sp. NPDC090273]|uniref:hypothetical protein n=1 Tax=Agrobacterium sp. NPDC090273 TaxID=3363919 RepID=UPI00383B09A6